VHRSIISFAGCAVELLHPAGWEDDLALLFGTSDTTDAAIAGRIAARATSDGNISLLEDDALTFEDLPRHEALHRLAGIVVGRLASSVKTGVSIHAGVVLLNAQAILIAGPTGAGKSTLTAWFVEKGYDYLTDEFALLKSGGALTGFPRAFMLKPGSHDIVGAFSRFSECPGRRFGDALMLRPPPSQSSGLPCRLIVFPDFNPGQDLEIEVLSAARASIALMACTGNTSQLADGGFNALNELASQATAVVVRYGAFSQIEGVLDVLARLLMTDGIDSRTARRFLAGITSSNAASQRPAVRSSPPAATPRKRGARLTIGMATYDDYDGVYFSLQAMRLYHSDVSEHCEFLVIDNNPTGVCAAPLKAFESHIPNYRYIPETTRTGTSIRNRVFEEAAGEFVLCMDCHVFIVPGALKRLLDYFSSHGDTRDLLQGPLLRDDLKRVYTHFRPEWRSGMFGVWDDNGLASNPDAPPYEVTMQGMGLFACRRDAWLGFNEAFRGFGGEEGYIHEKFRQARARTLCLPFLRWMHRFGRPLGPPYPVTFEDRIWNYLVGLRELNLSTHEMEQHFIQHIGEPQGSAMIAKLKRAFDMVGRAT